MTGRVPVPARVREAPPGQPRLEVARAVAGELDGLLVGATDEQAARSWVDLARAATGRAVRVYPLTAAAARAACLAALAAADPMRDLAAAVAEEKAAAEAAEAARGRLRAAVRAARRAGVTRADVIAASGLATATVDKWAADTAE